MIYLVISIVIFIVFLIIGVTVLRWIFKVEEVVTLLHNNLEEQKRSNEILAEQISLISNSKENLNSR